MSSLLQKLNQVDNAHLHMKILTIFRPYLLEEPAAQPLPCLPPYPSFLLNISTSLTLPYAPLILLPHWWWGDELYEYFQEKQLLP